MTTRQAGQASYSILARLINATLSPDPPVTRQRVYEWAEGVKRDGTRRCTPNKRGDPFPEPVRVVPPEVLRRGQPSRFWDVAEVLNWAAGGLPEQHPVAA